MLIKDRLEEIAEVVIPDGRHELFHVNPRKIWVDSVMGLIKSGQIKQNDKQTITQLAYHWEKILAIKYSLLN